MSGDLEQGSKLKKDRKLEELDVHWTPERQNTWKNFKRLLETSAEKALSQLDYTKELILMTDASKNY